MPEASSAPERVEAFTDGACSGNPGPGGWGAVLRWRGNEKELRGGEADTTNNRMLALGYAGWGPGQLDDEIHQNAWLNVPADDELVFDDLLDSKWERAIAKLGIDLSLLSGDAGHA